MLENEKKQIKENIERLLCDVEKAAKASGREPGDISIVLATKTQSAERINYACSCGICAIGENRVQELLEKYDGLDRDKMSIHFIGTLQTNKVKYIVDKVDLIHSVNSVRLAREIDKQSAKIGKISEILIEVNLEGEESKTGISPDEIYDCLAEISTLKNVRVRGLMAIPPKETKRDISTVETHECEDIVKNLQIDTDLRRYFKKITQLFLDISTKNIDNISMELLSLGMSGDYTTAIEEGSNMIRPGRAVFGERTVF